MPWPSRETGDPEPGRLTRLHTLNTSGTSGRPKPRIKPRGIPPALSAHGVYASSNPLEASLYGKDLLGTHRITVAGDPTQFEVTFHAVLFRDITLGHLDYGTEVEVEVSESSADHLVIVPANGTADFDFEDERITVSPVMAVIPRPSSSLRFRTGPQSALVIIRIARASLDLHLSRILGRTLDQPLQFDRSLNLAEGTASRWNFAVQIIHAELFDPDSLLHRGVGLGQLEEFVMSSLLYTQPSNYSDELADPHHAERRAVRRARDFIERRLAEQLTVAEVAEAAGVSVRTLQAFFGEDLQQTPTAFIRNRRLERVRADLADAVGGSGATVTEIASRWGFNHLGRFSSVYQQRFGESPSQTLRS